MSSHNQAKVRRKKTEDDELKNERTDQESTDVRLMAASVDQEGLISEVSFWTPEHLVSSAWHEHAPFAFWLLSVLRPRTLVELGSHHGFSFLAFCQAVERLRLPTKCFAIDTWRGDEHAGFYDDSVYLKLKELNDRRYGRFAQLVRSTFDEALAHFEDGAVDLLHIDGRHYYADVAHDFRSWLPKMSSRGIIIFHDTNVRAHNFGVSRLWSELIKDRQGFEFFHGHGLGILWVGSDLPRSVQRLFDATRDEVVSGKIRDVYARLGATISSDWAASSRGALLAQIEGELGAKRVELDQVGSELGAKASELERMRVDLFERDEAIKGLIAEAREMREKLAAAVGLVEQLEADARDSAERIATLSADAHARTEHIAMLSAKSGQLEEAAQHHAQRAAQLNRRLRKIKRSFSWRLLYPGRFLGSFAEKTWAVVVRLLRSLVYEAVGRYKLARRLLPLLAPAEQRELKWVWRIRKVGLTSDNWYRNQRPDLAKVNGDAALHYVRGGWQHGLDPNPLFDTDWYLSEYPDVRAAGIDPFWHYMYHGAAERRRPHPQFDLAYFEKLHPLDTTNPLVRQWCQEHAQRWPIRPEPKIADYLPVVEQKERSVACAAKVNVIVPVYRGLDETRSCLRELLEDPNRAYARLIVIDDCSPESELSSWLGELAGADKIDLRRNPVNLGFVQSVNRGMREADTDADVVLLNSDTEVPAGWLQRLAAHAYADESVGTVTPMSNNATICSYPSLRGGGLPFGKSLVEIDAACSTANAGRTISIPTAVGFCMYIRRDCLDDVGLFDAEHFGRGYGEENDFCLRATAKGWCHRLACDVFVYHRGEVSFGADAPERRHAWSLLVERYPHYPALINQFEGRDDGAPFRFAATVALASAARVPKVLVVTHHWGGGTERHVREVSCCDGCMFLRLSAAGERLELSVAGHHGHPTISISRDKLLSLRPILTAFGVSRAHIHHMIGIPDNISILLADLELPFDFTVHDYYSICPQIVLMDNNNRYCGEPDAAGCNACLSARPAFDSRDILSWRKRYEWLYRLADRVICPTRDVRDRLARHGLADRAIVVPHEPNSNPYWNLSVPAPPKVNEPLRVALIGFLQPHKGLKTLETCAAASHPAMHRYLVIGRCETKLTASAAQLVSETGQYEESNLPSLIEDLDPHIIWFPALWPETWSYTLSAAIESGKPIIASDMGALPERLRGRPWTWLLDPSASTADWLSAFATVRAELLAAVRPQSPVPRKLDATDFYRTDYLKPDRKSQ